jgi:YbbR domain-containing protein
VVFFPPLVFLNNNNNNNNNNSLHNKIKHCNLNLGVPLIAMKINYDAKHLVAFKQGSFHL